MSRQQRDTWSLIHALFGARIHGVRPEKPAELSSVAEERGVGEQRKAEILLANNEELQELVIAARWAESCANENVKYSKESAAWSMTLRRLIQKQSGHGRKEDEMLVSEMDPDAELRQTSDHHLHPDDEESNAELLKGIWLLIRAGRLDDALELCRICGQSWRAVSLGGGSLLHDPILVNGNGSSGMVGNPDRSVWRVACRAMSQDPNSSSIERAIYGSQCGDLDSILLACDSWEDVVWAHSISAIDARVENHLGRDTIRSPTSWTVKSIIEDLSNSDIPFLKKGLEDPYKKAQSHLLANEIDSAIMCMYSVVSDSTNNKYLTEESANFLRFCVDIAHYFVDCNVTLLPDTLLAYSESVRRYIDYLDQSGMLQKIPMFVVCLPLVEQIPVTARVFQKIKGPENRANALSLAAHHNLNIAEIARETVKCVISEGIPDESENFEERETDWNNLVSKEDRTKALAIEWLCFHPEHRGEAIIQANSLSRFFISTNKLDAARMIHDVVIPEDSIAVVRAIWEKEGMFGNIRQLVEENALKEFMCISSYLQALSAYDIWNMEYAKKKGKIVEVRSEEAIRGLQGALTFPGKWLVDVNVVVDAERQNELNLVQRQCIPEMVFLLHRVLSVMGRHSEALSIAEVVSDPVSGVFDSMDEESIKRLLLKIRESSISVLHSGSQDPLGVC